MRHVPSLLLALVSLPAAAQFSFTTETLVDDGLFNSSVSVGLDSQGNVHLSYYKQDTTLPSIPSSASREVWYATNASGAWVHQRITSNDVREEFPTLIVDADDNVHIAFHTGVDQTNFVRYINNIDGPFTGDEADIVTIAPNLSPSSGFIIPKFDVDPDGVVHFVFTDQNSAPDDVFYTTYDPATGATTPIINISNTPTSSEVDPHIAVGPDGVVHASWIGPRAGGGLTVVYVNNASGSFVQIPTNVTVSSFPARPVPLITPDNELSIAYRSQDVLQLIEAGDDFTFPDPPAPIALTPANRAAFYDKFAVGPDGRRYFAFAANVVARGTFFVAEPEEGFTPGVLPPQIDLTQTANPPLPPDTTGNGGASIAVRAGTIAVAWTRSFFADDRSQSDIYISLASLGTSCAADFNGDNAVDASDITAFLGAWFADRANGTLDADFNNSGVVDASDITAFLNAWFEDRASGDC